MRATNLIGLAVLLALLAAVALSRFSARVVAQVPGAQTIEAREVRISATLAGTATGPVISVPAAQREAAYQRLLALREQQAADALANVAPSDGAAPAEAGPATEVGDATAVDAGAPGNFLIGRDNRNPRANNPFMGSSLAEPSAANFADAVIAAGNFNHAEFSSDGGATWTDISPDNLGEPPPVFTDFSCCDPDNIIDDARRVGFYSIVYLNNAITTGAVRIHVLSNLDQGFVDCYYDLILPGVLLDYPHLGLTKRFLYLSANSVGPLSGCAGQCAQMYRFPTDDLATCTPVVVGSFFQWSAGMEGQRVWVPIGGTNNSETMYWAHTVNANTIRLFSWDENAPFVINVTRAVSTTNFAGPDCRGGVNNTNFVRGLDTSPMSFDMRGTLTAIRTDTIDGFGPGYHQGIVWYWPSGPNASTGQIQGFVRAALFRDAVGGLALVSQPDVWNPAFCFAFPIVTANKRGDVGVTLVLGGRAGGGGSAASGFVGIADEYTGGNGFFAIVFQAVGGTHNPADGRYGDYMTVHPYEPCEKWFSATAYALSGGTGVANVDERYVEFGRAQSLRCWNAFVGFIANQ